MNLKKACMVLGAVWFGAGLVLLILGLHFAKSITGEGCYFLKMITNLTKSPDQSVAILVALGLFLGWSESKWTLFKSARQTILRLSNLSMPLDKRQIFTLPYVITLVVTAALAFVALFLPLDLRSLIYIASGAGLLNASMAYYRVATTVQN